MTYVEFLTAVSAIDTLPKDVLDKAQELLDKDKADKVRRAGKRAEKALEKLPRIERAVSLLTDEPKTASLVAVELSALEGETVKVQTASALLRKAVELGYAAVQDVKVAKKGMQKGYTVLV